MAERKPFVIRMGPRGHEKVEQVADRHKISKSEAGRLALAFATLRPQELDQFIRRQLRLIAEQRAKAQSADELVEPTQSEEAGRG